MIIIIYLIQINYQNIIILPEWKWISISSFYRNNTFVNQQHFRFPSMVVDNRNAFHSRKIQSILWSSKRNTIWKWINWFQELINIFDSSIVASDSIYSSIVYTVNVRLLFITIYIVNDGNQFSNIQNNGHMCLASNTIHSLLFFRLIRRLLSIILYIFVCRSNPFNNRKQIHNLESLINKAFSNVLY